MRNKFILQTQLQAEVCIIAPFSCCSTCSYAMSLKLRLPWDAAAQAQLEEDMRRAAGEGQVHLDAQLQAEYYKIQEEAKSKTSRLRTDHEALRAAQVPATLPACLHEAHTSPRHAKIRTWCVHSLSRFQRSPSRAPL